MFWGSLVSVNVVMFLFWKSVVISGGGGDNWIKNIVKRVLYFFNNSVFLDYEVGDINEVFYRLLCILVYWVFFFVVFCNVIIWNY